MTKAVELAQVASTGVSEAFKNRIINGAMVIDQRNAGASVTGNNYPVDRWNVPVSQSSKLTAQQNAGSVTPPTGFVNYLGVTSSSSYSVTSGDYFLIGQAIEGYNTADFAWGTANAKTITLSFWVRSSLTGTFGGVVQNNDQTRSYPFTYTISSANTWEQKSITIAGDTSGTWNPTNGAGIRLWFGLGVGSTYSGTAGVWAGTNYNSATGATSVVGTNGATFYITGVQLEVGSTATSFEYRPYGTELQLCQRYFSTLVSPTQFVAAHAFSTNRVIACLFFPATTRANPTATTSGTITYFSNGGAWSSSAVTLNARSSGSVEVDITVNATSGSSGSIATNSTIFLNSEL